MNDGKPLRILLVEDSDDDAELVLRELEEISVEIAHERVFSEADLRRALTTSRWDVVLSDFSMPEFDGLRALEIVRPTGIPFVFVSGAIGEERAVMAMRNGAADYVLKSRLGRLVQTIRRVLEENENRLKRAEAERALEVEERRFERIFESAAVGQVEVDLSDAWAMLGIGVPGELPPLEREAEIARMLAPAAAAVKLLRANGSALALFGVETIADLAAVKSLPSAWGELLRTLVDGTSECATELVLEDKRRGKITVHLRAALPDDPEELDTVVVALLDVTERRRLERQLRAAQRMEAVGRLASGVAHDFNNLLSVILSYSDFVIETLEPETEAHSDSVIIRDSAQRAAQLVSQLLAFSRRQYQELENLDLNVVVRDLERMLRRVIGEDIDLIVRVEEGLGTIRADHAQIEQIVMNLVVNARDAMPDGGKLVIETKNVMLDAGYGERKDARVFAGDYVMLAVSDTGTGIDEATRDKVFEPFFTTKEQGKGTGLGLATVYGIVKQSKGWIWLYSEVGRGTTFKVYLPRIAESPSQRQQRVVPNRARGNETVLLVEDQELVRRAARRVLESYGYHVIEAKEGYEALAHLSKNADGVDVLITDLVMPNMSGRELSKRARDLFPSLEVIFMSGYSDHAAVHQGLLEETAEFLAKPISPEALAHKVREVIDTRPWSKRMSSPS